MIYAHKSLWIFFSWIQLLFAYILEITFFFVSAISSGLLQSEYVEPYTQEVNTQPEVGPVSHRIFIF